jgi:hypothetical protein
VTVIPRLPAVVTVPAALSAGGRGGGYWGVGPPGQQSVGRGEGQRLAREELSKAVYHPSIPLTQRILGAIGRALARLYNNVNASTPGGWWAFVVLAVLAVIVIGVVRILIGPTGRSHRSGGPPPLRGTQPLTARGHREQAARLAAAGDFSAAIVECVRAIAANLEERSVLPADAGRTADEFAAEASRALPACADALLAAARLFDDVCYGERQGTREGYERLRDLDAAIRTARPGRLAVLAWGDTVPPGDTPDPDDPRPPAAPAGARR